MSDKVIVTITNHEELLDFFCTARVHGDTVEMMNQLLSHRVYKDTRCGAWVRLEAPTTRRVGETPERWTLVYRTGRGPGLPLLGLCIRGDEWFHRSDLHEDVRNWAEPPGFTLEDLDKVRSRENGVIRVFAMSGLTTVEADVPVGVYEPVPAGVTFGSIVEGSDAEVMPETLRYPFTGDDVTRALEGIEAEVDRLWQEANEGDDENDELSEGNS